jgi:hypothetical protein
MRVGCCIDYLLVWEVYGEVYEIPMKFTLTTKPMMIVDRSTAMEEDHRLVYADIDRF